MEPPELISEEKTYISPLQPTVSPPRLTPVKSPNTSRRKPARVIISKVEDIGEYMDDLVMENHLPSFNVPEKIIIALDSAREDCTHFIGTGGKKIAPFDALKLAVEMFVKLKQRQNKNHEFALINLKEREVDDAIFGFTTDLDHYMCKLKKTLEFQTEEKFDLTSLFTIILNKIRMFEFFEDPSVPPPYVVRLILFYNRSHTIPEMHPTQNIKKLLNCPYFFVDVLVTHENVSEQNYCKEVFQSLQSIDTKGYSYFFNVGRNMAALTRSVLKLTGHPLQRPLQSLADYSL